MTTLPTLTRPLLAALLPLTLSLCAAAPPPEGGELRAEVGGEQYQFYTGGCGTTRYVNRAATGRGRVHASYRSTSGLSGSIEMAGSYGKVVNSTVIDENTDDISESLEGRSLFAFTLAARIGFHGRYAGGELGIAPYFTNSLTDNLASNTTVLPSARLWGGVPKYVYAWGEVVSGPTWGGLPGLGFGLGHASDSLRVEVGRWGMSWMAHAQIHATESLWLGARLQAGEPVAGSGSALDALGYLGAMFTLATPLGDAPTPRTTPSKPTQ